MGIILLLADAQLNKFHIMGMFTRTSWYDINKMAIGQDESVAKRLWPHVLHKFLDEIMQKTHAITRNNRKK